MATTTTTAPAEIPGLNEADKTFMDSWYQAVKDHPAANKKYTEWGTALAKKPTYDEKLAYIRSIINKTDPKYKANIPPLAVNWVVKSNPGIVDSKGDAFSTDFYKGIISGDAKTQAANSAALKTAKTKVATETAKLANPKATPKEIDAIVADIVNGSSAKPYTPTNLTTAVNASPSASLYKPGSMTASELKKTYGGLQDPDTGKPLFSDEDFADIAGAKTAAEVQGFNTTLSNIATKIVDSQKTSKYVVQSPADRAAKLNALLKDPAKLTSSANTLYTTNSGKKVAEGSGIDLLNKYSGLGVGDLTKEQQQSMLDAYDPNAGSYRAPTLNEKTGKYESTTSSPYTNTLHSLLGSINNPFASDYKSSLESRQPAAMTSTQLANISKPFDKNVTAKDIINLQNSAGKPIRTGLTKDSSLSENLLGLYQTNADGTPINSPWVADTENMVIPTTTNPNIDTSEELVQLDPAGLLRKGVAVDPNLAANQATAAGIDTLTGKPTVAGSAGIDTLAGATSNKKNIYHPVDNPEGDWVYMAGVEDPVPRFGVGPDGTQHDYGKEGVSLWNNQLVTPKELETINNYYSNHQLVHSDNGKILSGFDQAKLALWNSQFVNPPVVTDIPTWKQAGFESQESANAAKLLGLDRAPTPEQLRQQQMSQFSLTSAPETKAPETNQSIYVPPQATLNKVLTPEEKAAELDASVIKPFNAGIVTPDVNKVVSTDNMNSNVKGANGESSIVDLLKTPTSQPITTASPTGPYYNEQDQARPQQNDLAAQQRMMVNGVSSTPLQYASTFTGPYYNEQDQPTSQAAALAAQQGMRIDGVSSAPSNSGIISLVNPKQIA